MKHNYEVIKPGAIYTLYVHNGVVHAERKGCMPFAISRQQAAKLLRQWRNDTTAVIFPFNSH